MKPAPTMPRPPAQGRMCGPLARQHATNRVLRAARLHARYEGRDIRWRAEVILRAAIRRAIDAGVSDFELDHALAEGRRAKAIADHPPLVGGDGGPQP